MQNEIQVGRFNALLSKLFGITGAPSPVLATDVFPNIVVESDRPEWSFLKGEKLLGGYYGLAAGGAGTYGKLQLWNPAGSGVLAVVEKFFITATANTSWYALFSQTLVSATSATLRSRDTRAAVNPTCYLRYLVDASTPGNRLIGGDCTSGSPVILDIPMIVSPGYGFHIQLGANTTAYVAMLWRERVLERSETR